MPFVPKGRRSRWRTIYDALKATGVGDIVTYERLAADLGLDPQEGRHLIQMAMRRAARELGLADKRAVEAVPNQGYRVVEAVGHLVIAKRHQAKSARSLVRGYDVATNVDLTQVDGHTRRVLEVVAAAFSMQMDFNRRMDVRQRRLETAVAAQSERTGRTEEEIARLRAEVDALKSTIDRPD